MLLNGRLVKPGPGKGRMKEIEKELEKEFESDK